MVKIGLTDLPKSGGACASPAPRRFRHPWAINQVLRRPKPWICGSGEDDCKFQKMVPSLTQCFIFQEAQPFRHLRNSEIHPIALNQQVHTDQLCQNSTTTVLMAKLLQINSSSNDFEYSRHLMWSWLYDTSNNYLVEFLLEVSHIKALLRSIPHHSTSACQTNNSNTYSVTHDDSWLPVYQLLSYDMSLMKINQPICTSLINPCHVSIWSEVWPQAE